MAFCAAIVSSVSPSCERIALSKAISSGVLSWASLQAKAEIVKVRLQHCIKITSVQYMRQSKKCESRKAAARHTMVIYFASKGTKVGSKDIQTMLKYKKVHGVSAEEQKGGADEA